MGTILSPTYKRDFPYKRKHSQLKYLKESDLQNIVYIPGILRQLNPQFVMGKINNYLFTTGNFFLSACFASSNKGDFRAPAFVGWPFVQSKSFLVGRAHFSANQIAT